MPGITTEDRHPDHGLSAIIHTKGVWIRTRDGDHDDTELWIDGEFKASWSGTELTPDKMLRICQSANTYGKAQGKKELRAKLKKLLGL